MRFAVILAGGGGTRLWPASRRARPKQFLPLGTQSGESLLAATARRLEPVCGAARTVVVTAASHAERVRAELPSLPPDNIIGEPEQRNTAAALGLAATLLAHRDADAVLGAIPSDHLVVDERGFAACVDLAFAEAESREATITIGIVPTRPETGFGYLHLGAPAGPGLRWVDSVVEKPDADTAVEYLASGEYLWNGGMFFARASHLLAEIARFLPETSRGLDEIARALAREGSCAGVIADVYASLPAVSIDYGVMEKTEKVLTIPGDFGWNDVGSWSSLADYRDVDQTGNVVSGTAVVADSTKNIIVADDGTLVGLIGVSDLVVISSGNVVLVAPRARAQEVRDLVEQIESAGGELEKFL